MSIIADTLKRLQAQADDSPPKSKEDVVPRPAFNKGEGSGRHRKNSPFAFLMVTLGMTMTLGSLALAAFWIGGHLDFGMGTASQAGLNNHRALPRSLDVSEDSTISESSSKPLVATASEPTQGLINSSNAGQNDQLSASATFDDQTSLQSSSPQKETVPSQSEDAIIDAPSTNKLEPIALSEQPKLADQIDLHHEEQEETTILISSVSDEPVPVKVSPVLPTELIDDDGTDMIVTDEEQEGESLDLLAMLSEEEIIETEEFVKPSNPSTHSAPRSITLATLQAERQSANHKTGPVIPLKPSPASRLRHAQELIRSGEYEDAVTLLAPLFHVPPVNWQPWFWMGTALLGKGDIDKADQFFLSGLARNDKIPQLWIQRALVAQQRGDFQVAIHELRQAESLAADLPHIHLNMGYAYEQLGNDQMANQYYGKFLKLSEDQPSFFSTRKKLFARLTQQAVTEKDSSPSLPPSRKH